MNSVLPVLGVMFVAFCIWLGVRIYSRRERWAKRTLAAVIGLPVLYVASFGPACWLLSTRLEREVFKTFKEAPFPYGPIGWATRRAPKSLASSIEWYATLTNVHNESIHYWWDGREDEAIESLSGPWRGYTIMPAAYFDELQPARVNPPTSTPAVPSKSN